MPSYPCRDKLHLHYFTRLLHPSLSKTLLRVICTYLTPLTRLIHLTSSQISVFDLQAEHWESYITAKLDLPLELFSGIREFETWTSVIVGELEVFAIVGDIEGRRMNVALVKPENWAIKPDFAPYCTDFGLIYDSIHGEVFVFGGVLHGNATVKTHKFTLNTEKWVDRRDMTEARYAFNPVMYGDLVYLCGGGVNSLETYSPYRDESRLIRGVHLPPDRYDQWETSTTLGMSVLVIVTDNSLCQFSPTRGDMEVKPLQGVTTSWRSAYSPAAPIVVADKLYMVDCCMRVVRRLDMSSGRLEAVIRS